MALRQSTLSALPERSTRGLPTSSPYTCNQTPDDSRSKMEMRRKRGKQQASVPLCQSVAKWLEVFTAPPTVFGEEWSRQDKDRQMKYIMSLLVCTPSMTGRQRHARSSGFTISLMAQLRI